MKSFSILLVTVSLFAVSCERHEFEGPQGTKQLNENHAAAPDEHERQVVVVVAIAVADGAAVEHQAVVEHAALALGPGGQAPDGSLPQEQRAFDLLRRPDLAVERDARGPAGRRGGLVPASVPRRPRTAAAPKLATMAGSSEKAS